MNYSYELSFQFRTLGEYDRIKLQFKNFNAMHMYIILINQLARRKFKGAWIILKFETLDAYLWELAELHVKHLRLQVVHEGEEVLKHKFLTFLNMCLNFELRPPSHWAAVLIFLVGFRSIILYYLSRINIIYYLSHALTSVEFIFLWICYSTFKLVEWVKSPFDGLTS